MVNWHGRPFVLNFSSLGDDLLQPAPFNFRFAESRDVSQQIYLYTITPDTSAGVEAPPSVWNGVKLLPQGGRRLTRFIPPSKRLDPESAHYTEALQDLVDSVMVDKIEEDPFAFERLVGAVPKNNKFNPVSFYKLENTHTDPAKVLLLVRLNLVSASPNGTLAAVG